MTTIQQTIDELRSTLTEYIEATYHIAHPIMVHQRRQLLEAAGGTFQFPYLESTPRYITGSRYEDMTGIPAAAREAFVSLADPAPGRPLLFNPPYSHQADAIQEALGNRNNLMIMTGTGSGKTESFLLPILGKFAIEARDNPHSFASYSAVRAIILYPMNALVNDQLGRLRLLFGNPRVISLFERWAGRPARFARYTSRTPYAGVRSPSKDSNRLSSVGDFFAAIEEAAGRHTRGQPRSPEEDERGAHLFAQLGRRGKWPSKESISNWFGQPHSPWRDRNGNYRRGVTGAHDAELLTRHEVQTNPPDLLITNYSMLEYMMMRPIERPIFDRTRAWLEACPDERILVVLDEAHLYRGAQGAEVGLLLRRLRERLGLPADRFQVICATASFSEEGRQAARYFGAQLTGVPAESFVSIVGQLNLRQPAAAGMDADVTALCQVDLPQLYSSDLAQQQRAIEPFLAYRGRQSDTDVGVALYDALEHFPPFNQLVNETMQAAIPVAELGSRLFPGIDPTRADLAVGALLALGSRARRGADQPSLLPCRIHSFFRGLPGLWICMDPNCTELREEERGGPGGKLYAQSHDRCACGAPVLEYFTCRHCGTSYARAYTNDVSSPQFTWSNPGEGLQTDAGYFEAKHPLDLMLEEPPAANRGLPTNYDLRTGLLNPASLNERHRIIYLRPPQPNTARDQDQQRQRGAGPGEYYPCGCCGRGYTYGQSSVQDHQTKGDQPFQALLSTQIRVQPPGPQAATDFAPLRGRKVLVFSDSRQMAARLAPTLQSYSLRDLIRALLPAGFRMLAADPQFGSSVVLDHAFLAVIVAAHRFGVRVRPELNSGEMMPVIEGVPTGQVPSGQELTRLANARCPANLLRAMTGALTDYSLGLEPLAIASIRESEHLTARLLQLPAIPGLAEDGPSRLAVVRAWLRCWSRSPGIWFRDAPPEWWTTEVRTHRGEFEDMNHVLVGREAKRVFRRDWLARLLTAFTQRSNDGGTRLLASNLSLEIGGAWRRCPLCKSVHRPIERLTTCIDCEQPGVEDFDPDDDPVFLARRGYYRNPVIEALSQSEPTFISLIAAEHTAQLGAAQVEDVFSEAENHEIRFQDINLAWRDTDMREPAIDVLSSTTTMEVGIDIGELSGVALRNMPPGRANYQQRAGRAGRRGTAVATVIAFGSADSHDDHYFVRPDEMIRGPVVDPRLTLENPDIARRHLRAYLLQRYHEARIPNLDPEADPNLFSVLGYVHDFRSGTGVLHREDLRAWLEANRAVLQTAAARWLPSELSDQDRQELIDRMSADLIQAVDEAVGFVPGDPAPPPPEPQPEGEAPEAEADPADDNDLADPGADKLLDRLLYWGVLPRYAFPTDVAPFYVFNRALSTPFRPRMSFAPTQGLNIALSQYAPNKQIWIKGSQYTSKAIYSPYRHDRRDAWSRRRLYFECSRCGHARTEDYVQERENIVIDCEACRAVGTFGPAKRWFRPPGFAHPIDREPLTAPDSPNETAYATRAKLVMSTPADGNLWVHVGDRVRAFPTRDHLLVSNSGPDGEGYDYCTRCGRIEAAAAPEENLFQPHSWPFRTDEEGPCPGAVARRTVLGTDFRTDVALFSLPLDAPFRLRPGNDETSSALRTICEAIAKSACRLLQIEPSEILAEYRPAITEAGANGLEAEVFVYDTLAGGAGFSPQLASMGQQLFEEALNILSTCPENCDSSCYRCLRSFRNKLDHRLLDRKLGEQLLRHAVYGGYPAYPQDRVDNSLDLLFDDARRQLSDQFQFERNVARAHGGNPVNVPLVITRRSTNAETWVTLGSPVAPDVPVDGDLRAVASQDANRVVCIDDLLIRRNFPAAITRLSSALR